jgi:hypothetical protein
MKAKMKVPMFLFGVVMSGFAGQAAAQSTGASMFVFRPALSYSSHTEVIDDSSDQTTGLGLNVDLGYATGSSLYAGLKYLQDSESFASDSLAVDAKANGLGLSLGYMRKGAFSVTGTYFFQSQMELTYDDQESEAMTSTFSGGTAYSLELGLPLNAGFIQFGPVFSYMYMDYKKEADHTSAGTETVDLDTKYSDTWVKIYLGAWLTF